MVRGDVGDDRDVRLEVIYVVKLEAAEFKHIDVVLLCSYLVCVALSDVSAQSDVEAGVLEQVIDQGSGCGLSVASGDAHLLCRVISARELDLRDHVDAAFDDLLHHRCRRWDAWALDDLISVEDKFLRVLALLVWNIPLLEHSRILLGDVSHIREEYIETLCLCEDCGTYSAFASA